MGKREVVLEPGSQIQLTSLRTRRKVHLTTSELIGLGGMAKVYAGVTEDGTQVVLKTQRFEGRGADHSLEVEIELFKKLFHRNIVHCVGVGVTPNGHLIIGFRRAYQNPLLLMANAAVDEGMRRDKKARYPHLPLDTAIDLVYELLNGLAYLERLGFVHHDVKLANLLIDVAPKERPLEGHEIFGRVARRAYRGVLIDFGATRSRNYLDAWNRGEATEGGLAPQITPFYAPPEAVVEARNEQGDLRQFFDVSLDVYAAALLLFAAVTGHPPYSHLREPPDPHDLESVIAVKAAERRGEIQTISRETIRRVVFDETKFLDGDRASFDTALNKFLLKRLDPDPTKRGSSAEMKRDFERLMRIRSARVQGEARLGGSRVFLPFKQELVEVGGGGEHPLLRAARLYGLERRREESGALPVQRPKRRPGSGSDVGKGSGSGSDVGAVPGSGSDVGAVDPKAKNKKPDSGEGSLDWLEDMDATGQKEGEGKPPPRRAQPPVLPPRPVAKRRARKKKAQDPEELTRAGGIPLPGSGKPELPAATPADGETGRPVWGRDTNNVLDREELLRRAGRGRHRRRRAHDSGRSYVNAAATRSGQAIPKEDPVARGYPPEAAALAPHCLLSPVLDTPLLLSRERRYLVGRDPSVDVRIKSDLVSRRHAEINWDGKGFVLTDLGALNGTSLNGKRLAAPVILHDEDRIGFGGFEFVVRVLSGNEWSVEEGGGTTKIFRGEVDWTRNHTPAFSGDLSRLAIRDVIEIIDWKRHSGTLELQDGETALGKIQFIDGTLVHAEGRGGTGLEVALDLLTQRKGHFAFKHGKPECETTIDIKLDELWERVEGRTSG